MITFRHLLFNLSHTSKVRRRRKVCKFYMQTLLIRGDCMICYKIWPDGTYFQTQFPTNIFPKSFIKYVCPICIGFHNFMLHIVPVWKYLKMYGIFRGQIYIVSSFSSETAHIVKYMSISCVKETLKQVYEKLYTINKLDGDYLILVIMLHIF